MDVISIVLTLMLWPVVNFVIACHEIRMRFQNMMSGLCRFKDILGTPGEGFHSLRVGGFAALDIAGTLLVGLLLAKIFSKNIVLMTVLAFIIGEALHWVFCVDTSFILMIRSMM